MGTIVVGVDGSAGASAALELAAAEAVLRGAGLRVVSAWQVPIAAYGGGGAAGTAPLLDTATLDAFRVSGERVAEEALEAVRKLQPSLDAEAVTVEGQPADVLVAQGSDAELIVVGRRGLGGFKSLLLGSVSHQVVQHAPCPVVVVNQ